MMPNLNFIRTFKQLKSWQEAMNLIYLAAHPEVLNDPKPNVDEPITYIHDRGTEINPK